MFACGQLDGEERSIGSHYLHVVCRCVSKDLRRLPSVDNTQRLARQVLCKWERERRREKTNQYAFYWALPHPYVHRVCYTWCLECGLKEPRKTVNNRTSRQLWETCSRVPNIHNYTYRQESPETNVCNRRKKKQNYDCVRMHVYVCICMYILCMYVCMWVSERSLSYVLDSSYNRDFLDS